MVRSTNSGGNFSNLTGAHGTDAPTDRYASLRPGSVTDAWHASNYAGMYLDSPSYTLGASVQYKIGTQSENTTYAMYVGSTQRGGAYHAATASVMIGLEIAT